MTFVTPRLGLWKPDLGDDPKALRETVGHNAQVLEDYTGAQDVTALPGGTIPPGLEIVYRPAALAAKNVHWKLRRNGTTNLWEWDGGGFLVAEGAGSYLSTPSASYQTLGLSITVPATGEYWVLLEALMSGSQASHYSFNIGAVAAISANALISPPSGGASTGPGTHRRQVRLSLTAGTVLTACGNNNGGQSTIASVQLGLQPITLS